MKRITYISLYLLVLLIYGCGPAARKDHENEMLADSVVGNEVILQELESDSLSPGNLDAFENRAIQKLEDLAGYIEIVSDTTLDKSFREQALTMALDLFESGNQKISTDIQGNVVEKPIDIGAFLKSLKESRNGKQIYKAGKIDVTNRLQRNNNDAYSGNFQCIISVSNGKPIPIQVNITVKQINKDFGGVQKVVWEVFLGDIIGL